MGEACLPDLLYGPDKLAKCVPEFLRNGTAGPGVDREEKDQREAR